MQSTEKPSNPIEIIAEVGDAGQRLDRWLAEKITSLSRARLQALIRQGCVYGPGTIREPRTPVKLGQTYRVCLPEVRPAEATAETIPLAIVYEDDDLIVIDKPAGLVVHPAAGHASGTLVNALIAHCGTSLSGIGGVQRPGIVHRLDKDTSGLLVVAKNDATHRGLSEQFKSHGRDGRLHRSYLAFAWGQLQRPKGRIDEAVGRSRANPMKIAVLRNDQGRSAVTHYEVLDTTHKKREAGSVSLLRLILETGRTHQIRVHLAHIGHPILGDATYAAGFKTRTRSLSDEARAALEALDRQALHADTLQFEHPTTGKILSFNSELPAELKILAKALNLAPQAPTATSPRRRQPNKRS